MKEILKYPNCFVCGENNPSGLKVKFYFAEDVSTTDYVADDRFEGYQGIFHGGILTTLLDEVMIKAILANNEYAVTAEITTRFLLPVEIGDRLRIFGRLLERKGRVFYTEANATRENGDVVASAKGKCIEAKPKLRERLIKSVINSD